MGEKCDICGDEIPEGEEIQCDICGDIICFSCEGNSVGMCINCEEEEDE